MLSAKNIISFFFTVGLIPSDWHDAWQVLSAQKKSVLNELIFLNP